MSSRVVCKSKLLHSFCVTFLALVVKSDPFLVCGGGGLRKRDTKTVAHRGQGPGGGSPESL